MGLFDKKFCDICGEKIGMLGNRKLEDGNLCKGCAKKLSPWFDERRHSTVEQIKAQLQYREENKNAVRSFNATREFGISGNGHLYVDESKGQFVATRHNDVDWDDNPDVISLSQITSCYLDIEERREEEFYSDDGEQKRYNPPRYKYSYDYTICIKVNAPYFDEIKIELNSFAIKATDNHRRHQVESTGREIEGYIARMTGMGMPGQMQGGMMGGMGMPNQMGGQMNQGMMNQGMPGQMQGGMMGGMGMPNQMGGQMNQGMMNQGMPGQMQGGMMGGMGMSNQMGGQMNQGMMNQGMPGQMQGQQMGGMGMPNQMGGQQPQQAGGQWQCPSCGAFSTGRFCESCGTPRP